MQFAIVVIIAVIVIAAVFLIFSRHTRAIPGGGLPPVFEERGFEEREGAHPQPQPQPQPAGPCTTVVNNGSPSDKLDIVFVGDNYAGDSAKFANDVTAHANELFSITPFDIYRNRINIHRVTNPADVGCTFSGRDINCDLTRVSREASACPNDQVVVLYNTNRWGGAAIGLLHGGISLVASAYPWITVHELGHSFGGLWDEYDYVGSAQGDITTAPNCDNDNTCPKWSSIPNTGCFRGCATNSFYRSIDNGLMRTANSRVFGIVNELHLIEHLSAYR